MPAHIKRALTTITLATALALPTYSTATASATASPSTPNWRPVPAATRAQFRADGQPLRGYCRIRYGDTTYIRCTYHGITTTYSS